MLGLALCVVGAAPAHAATLERGRYVAGPGEVNRLTLTYSDGWFHYSDPGAAIAPEGPDCELTHPGGHAARCRADTVRLEQPPETGRDHIPRPSAVLGDGDDVAEVRLQREEATRIGVAVAGGPGADVLTAAAPMAVIHGDSEHSESALDGADRITVDAGEGRRDAEKQWDQLSPTAAVSGGGGDDVVSAIGVYNRIWGEGGDDVLTGDDLHPPPEVERCFLGECFTGLPGQNCWGGRGMRSDEIEGGAGNDRIYGRSGEDYLFGGGGSDVVEGGADCDTVIGDDGVFTREGLYAPDDSTGGGADSLDGGGEEDRVFGGPGDDRVGGGEGYDYLSGGGGADTVDGGAGVDMVRYADRTAPVVVTLDAVSDDGEAGERDRIGPDVEEVFGTPAADRIEGSAGDNVLSGGDGDDVIVGGGGSDVLAGHGGSDRIHALEREPAVPHQPILFFTAPASSLSYYDDAVSCDSERATPPPDATYPIHDPGAPGTNDVVVADATDGTGQGGVPFKGCEVVLHSDAPVTVDPETTTSVPTPAYCDAGPRGSRCKASATVLAAAPSSLGASRFKPPKRWQRLGRRSYEAKLGGKRRRVRVPVSRAAARRARGGKRVKAYVAYRYAKPKR